ncbi:MAG: HAD-IIIC family phosphatase [Labilithrix sp.]|nr:HAD-IIIC family phosphatase [Labilithrix sp.]MCW5811272.1 HAD-IIIC family phosphatase [Labilithrix sp.]
MAAELSPAEYMKAARALKDDATAKERLTPLRLVVLSSFTTALLDAYLKVEAAKQGFYADIHHGGFNQFEQELLGDAWRAKNGEVEALVVMMRLEDLQPDVGFRVYSNEEGDAFDALSANVLGRIEATLGLFRDKGARGPALVANFLAPEARLAKLFDANQTGSLTYKVMDLNRALLEKVSARAGCHVWDYAGLVSSVGTSRWTDPRLWALARNPIAAANQPAFAQHLTRTLRGTLKPAAKCLVLDLDNTLWGGVIGDDGVAGIHLGDEHPGRAFKELQRAVLGLRDRGIVLALASKNDLATVQEALTSHPEMLIKMTDFAAVEINWERKSKNLKAIASDLNIGADSLVFFDDNPVERAEVKENLPEVIVVDVPVDPAHYVRALTELDVFDVPRLTKEDRLRAQSYQAQIERREAEATAGSLDEFLPTLNMEAEIGAWNAVQAQRITQLVGKTNQFNTTTRRLTEPELAKLHEEGLGVYWLRLTDRYGDLGLVGVFILTKEGDDAIVHSLVLSCRVANRGVEQTMVAYLAGKARAAGCKHLVGEFIPTKKNTPVIELYPRLGFEKDRVDGDLTRYRYDLARTSLVIPSYVRVREPGA